MIILCKTILQKRIHFRQKVRLDNFCFTRFVGYALVERGVVRAKDRGQSRNSFFLKLRQLFVQLFFRSGTSLPKYLQKIAQPFSQNFCNFNKKFIHIFLFDVLTYLPKNFFFIRLFYENVVYFVCDMFVYVMQT